MFKYLLFNLFCIFSLNSILHGQKREEKVQLITTLVERTKSDTTLKFFVLSKEQLSKLTYYAAHIEMSYKKDTLVKVLELITHPAFKQIEYYFLNGRLAFVRFHQERYCSNQFLYFNDEKLIKVKTKECNLYKNGNKKKEANFYVQKAKDFLEMFKSGGYNGG